MGPGGLGVAGRAGPSRVGVAGRVGWGGGPGGAGWEGGPGGPGGWGGGWAGMIGFPIGREPEILCKTRSNFSMPFALILQAQAFFLVVPVSCDSKHTKLITSLMNQ